jgi:hypothetical protein
VNDSSPGRLELLRFARRVVAQQAAASLAQLDGWIAEEERRQVARERAEAARGPAGEWLVEQSLNGAQGGPVFVHVGGCWDAGKRSRAVSRDQARRALSEGVDPCPQCRPDTELGLLE